LSVSDLRWFSDIPGSWDYAEITQISASILPEGKIHVEVMLWSEDAGISITAEHVLFDGGDGERFLTDYKFAWSCYSPSQGN
jgi:hypothetical protein